MTGVADPAGSIGFSPSLAHLRVPSSWATWSHGYAGDVYFTGGGSEGNVEITLPPGTKAFAFYAEPNTFADFTVEAIADDGTSSEPVDIQGNSGARYFGFYANDARSVASIRATHWFFSVGTPLIRPCPVIVRPGGRPVADQTMVCPCGS